MVKLFWRLCTLISPHQNFWCLQRNDGWAMGHKWGDFTGMSVALHRVRDELRGGVCHHKENNYFPLRMKDVFLSTLKACEASSASQEVKDSEEKRKGRQIRS